MNEPVAESWTAGQSADGYPVSVLLVAVLALGMVNFSAAPLLVYSGESTMSAIVACAAVGVIFAQGILLAIYLVFDAGPFWERLGIHWSAAALAWLVWYLGYWWVLEFESNKSDDALTGLTLEVPLCSLALQAPLWLVRCFTMRLQRGSEPSPERPWSIADLLFGTTIVAISLAAAMIKHPTGGTALAAAMRPTVLGLTLGVMVALPLSWAILRVRHAWLAGATAALYGSLLVGSSITIVLMTGGAANIGPWILVAIGVGEAACLATVAFGLAIARRRGWRFTIGRGVLSTRLAVVEQPTA